MSIVRLIHITLDPSEAENAVRVWKTECAPLMKISADLVRNIIIYSMACAALSLAAFSASLPATAPQNLKNPESF